MDLEDDDELVGMSVVNKDLEVLTITSNGYGKKSSPEDYRVQKRAGKGVKAGQLNEKTGKLVCLTFVAPDEDVMLITDNGIIIRVKSSEISTLSRDTQGVIVMRLNEGQVATVAVVPSDFVYSYGTPANASAMFACVPSVCVYLPPNVISVSANAGVDIAIATKDVKTKLFFIFFSLF